MATKPPAPGRGADLPPFELAHRQHVVLAQVSREALDLVLLRAVPRGSRHIDPRTGADDGPRKLDGRRIAASRRRALFSRIPAAAAPRRRRAPVSAGDRL